MSRTLNVHCILFLAFLAVPCQATVITASGAGSSLATAEDLTGLFPTEIIGTLSGIDQNDVSMFEISNADPTNFSAITEAPGAFGIPDTVLSLFNSSGVGIFLNDDISGADTLSCLPSAGVGNPCPTSGIVLPGGTYYLAISRSANYPVDASNNEIFQPSSSTDLVGPSSTNPVAGWDGGAFTSPDFDLVNYDIVLTGTTPEPATWLLLTAGGLALGLFRKYRR